MSGTQTLDPAFIGNFSLKITEALRDQLLAALKRLKSPEKLTVDALKQVEERPGVYQLFLDGDPVYVGKASVSLRARLDKHRRKLSGRKPTGSAGSLVERATFRCLYVDEDLDAMAPERMLIATLIEAKEADWNRNGFGSNDPGIRRDTSRVKGNHFDVYFPIDLDTKVTINGWAKRGKLVSLYDLMRCLKLEAPFVFRFPGASSASLAPLKVEDRSFERFKGQELSIREWLQVIADLMPAGWLITVLPGYVIAYPGTDPSPYESRRGSWLTSDTKDPTPYIEHDPAVEAGEVDEEDNAVLDADTEELVDAP